MPHARSYPTELYLCTTLIRQDNGGEPVECDAIVYFEARMTSPGYRATWTDPAAGPEYECTFSSADLDGIPSDAPGPLTATETQTLRTWFDAQEHAAWECANDNYDRGN
jgi:hypothetical protein